MTLDHAREVLQTEADAILSLIPRIGADFERAVDAILRCKGHVVVTGMGKAGLVGQKISATFASTGTPSIFLHPAEAYHGDLGRVVPEDVVLVLSNSGETEEILRLLPMIRRLGTPVIAITSRAVSSLGPLADIVVEIGEIEEACPLRLAPSASTTALLAMGDALALTVLHKRGFTKEQFAFYHPAGELGRKLQKVGEVMRTGERHPVAAEETTVLDAIALITKARAGAVSVVDGSGRLAGIFTDGDLRRLMSRTPDRLRTAVREVMTRRPVTVGPDRLAADALKLLRERKIDEIPVVDGDGRPVGMLDVQDLLDVDLV
ncbi:MAG: KpsF/GutQ family sugar-phosphate isomerase [Planctomycetes bacterium]|nr:KpsF/GutQ family sugar-phosphate isomerase [Planctomycetota bacterium]